MLWNWHLDMLCEYLQLVTSGARPCEAWREANGERDELTRLVVNEPPGMMKSLVVSVMWPCWEWLHRPETRTIFSSYSHGVSIGHSALRRAILSSEWYVEGMRGHWGHPDFGLTKDTEAVVHNSYLGRMQTTSTGGTITGFHGDRIVVDDPVNPQEAVSQTERDKANAFFDLTLSQRIIDKNRPVYILVMQRLHQDDLTGHLLKRDPAAWVHVMLDSPAVEDQTLVFPRSGRTVERRGGGLSFEDVGGVQVSRVAGDLLWPERESAAATIGAKTMLGSWGFAGQYLQRPTPLEGGVLKRAHWRRGVPPREFERMVQSWDFAFKSSKTSDHVAGFVIGKIGADKWLLDCVNAHLSFSESLAAVRNWTAKWPDARAKLVEDKANGTAIIDTLNREIPGLIAVEPHGGKLSRAMACQPDLEAGNWWIPAGAPWAHDFVEQAAAFRGVDGDPDDMVDAWSQGGIYLSGSGGGWSLEQIAAYGGLDVDGSLVTTGDTV